MFIFCKFFRETDIINYYFKLGNISLSCFTAAGSETNRLFAPLRDFAVHERLTFEIGLQVKKLNSFA